MYSKTRAIVLKNTNYSESSIISKIYTREFGIKTYILRGVRKGKSKIRTSMIQPLSLVELDVYQKPNTSINNIKDLRNSPVLYEIQDDIIKKSVAMFMSEIVNYCLTEEASDKELFDFLENQIIDLDQKKMSVLFPSLFLLDLSKYLGIYPQGKFSDGTPFFSYEDGFFIHESTIHTASEKSSQMISQMIHEGSKDLKLDALARKNVLVSIVKYYQFHVIRNKKVKSIDIISEILN